MVAKEDNKIIGLIKSYTSEYRALAHVMANTTVMIHPNYQSKGYGGLMIRKFCDTVKSEMQHIYMIELVPHSNNTRAIKFYIRNGFHFESKTRNRIFTENGNMVDELKMVWKNPNFDYQKLFEYHKYCSEYLKRKYGE